MNLHKNSNYIFHEIQIKYWDSDFIVQTKYHWQYSRCWTLHNDCRWHYRQEQKQNPGFACHYLASFTIEENYLSIKGTNNRSAKEIFSFIKDTLADFKIFKDGLISQSYNGASIISGDYSGLQIFISNFCRYFKSFLDLFHTYIIFCKWFIL